MNTREQLWQLGRRWGAELALALGLAVCAMGVFVGIRTSIPVIARYSSDNVSIDKPFVVRFNQSNIKISTKNITISPSVKGKWSTKTGSIFSNDQLTFTPESNFKANTTYTIKSIYSHRLVGVNDEIILTFKTEAAAGVDSARGLAALKDGDTIAADANLSVSLKKANNNLRSLVLHTTPAIDVSLVKEGGTTYEWRAKDILPQGSDVNIEVYDEKNDETLVKKTVKVAAEPSVVSLGKPTNFVPGDTQTITFSAPVKKDSAVITFDVDGTGSWQSSTEYTFKPTKVEPGRTYSYAVKDGLRSEDGGIVIKPLTGTFTSAGSVVVVGMSPYGSGLSQAVQTISFTFDKAVNHDSVVKRFSVSSGTVASTSWKGNTFSAVVKNLGYQRTVRATVAAGVENTTFGLPSVQAYSVSFTTEIRSVRYNVPFYRQQYAGSCTAASLRMILAYRGISADDMAIIQRMGYSPRAADTSTNPPTWDDPSEMFVGDVNGKIGNFTGAGPDAPPVAKAANSYGRSATAVQGIGVGWIAQQLYDGNPVIIFGSWNNKNSYVSWVTSSGKEVKMNITGHAMTVIGVKGEPSSPIGFWINDPLSSGTKYWTAAELQATINLDVYHQAVVVR